MFKSFSIKRVLKLLLLKKRFQKVVKDVQKDEKSTKIALKIYEVNRIIIQNKIKNKFIKSHLIKKRILLIENEEQFLLNFSENYFEFEFSTRL
jgi:murein endopeptidase